MLTSHDIRSCRRDDSGFSLAELIVAMVLTGIFLAIVGTVVIDAMQNARDSSAERRAIVDAANAGQQMGDDLRKSRSPDREAIDDPEVLRQMLMNPDTYTPPTQVVDGQTVEIDPRDIVYASGTRVEFRSDVLPAAGVECVAYWVGALPGKSNKRALVRDVTKYVPMPSPRPAVPPADAGRCQSVTDATPAMERTILLEEVGQIKARQ